MQSFVDVIIPVSIRKTLTYSVPEELTQYIETGVRVEVELGKRKRYSGIVLRHHLDEPKEYKVKDILNILDTVPVINSFQLKLWQFIADYYLCTLGEVMNVGLPAGLKLSSETRIISNFENLPASEKFTNDQFLILSALNDTPDMTLQDIQSLVGKKSIIRIIQELLKLGLVTLQEELKNSYKPKTERVIIPLFSNTNFELDEIFSALKNAGKQIEIILFLLQHMKSSEAIQVSLLNQTIGPSDASLKSLEKKELIRIEERTVSRVSDNNFLNDANIELSEAQKTALDQIESCFETKQATLLHGVTGSGKTLIYMKLIEKTIHSGRQVLYLIPEIALTTQLVQRVKNYFGEVAEVYHSSKSLNHKVDLWHSVLNGKKLIIAARSGIFLPFEDLGLIIIDEEHDFSYKQNEPVPRYHAREASIFLASIHNARVLLGSATPSLESTYNAKKSKFGHVFLRERYGASVQPEVIPVKVDFNSKLDKSHFSPLLIQELINTLADGRQAIIFQNRRGFSPALVCGLCGWTKTCKNCDVTMTYHKYNHSFMCHYCGWTNPTDSACPSCGNVDLNHKGFGTEKIEEELTVLFPEARIARMDLDTAKGSNALTRIIYELEFGLIDILIGTQMISKGLDFENIGLVGVVSADQLTRFPDFRSHEKAFDLMVQVGGRSGRSKNKGKVLIQYDHINPALLEDVIRLDYFSFYEKELAERRKFNYPPLTRLIRIQSRHKDPRISETAMNILGQSMLKRWGERITGPAPALIPRIRNLYIYELLIKLERNQTIIAKIKSDLLSQIELLSEDEHFRSVRFSIDVDPM